MYFYDFISLTILVMIEYFAIVFLVGSFLFLGYEFHKYIQEWNDYNDSL